MADRQIVVEIVGDASKFNKATDQAVQKGGALGNVVKGIGVGVGLGAFNLASQGIGMLTDALGQAQQAYKDDQVSQQMMRTALQNNVPAWNGSTKAIEDYAAAQMELGFTDDEVRQSISQLIGITHDEAKAMELNSLAQDLARSKGIDLATATDLVTKAAQGNGRALKAMGVDIGNATDAAGMLDAIQQNVQGSAEAWAETSEGQTAVAQARQGEAWEKIGKVVDRIAVAVLPILTEGLELVADVIEQVSEALGPWIDWFLPKLIEYFRFLASVIKGVVDILSGVISFLVTMPGKVERAVRTLWDPIPKAFRAAINFLIGIWNRLGFTMPVIDIPVLGKFGGFRIGVPQVPYLHAGGIVPGTPGSDVPAILQAGERVLPRNQSAMLVVNVYGDTYGDGIDRLAEKIAFRMRLKGV